MNPHTFSHLCLVVGLMSEAAFSQGPPAYVASPLGGVAPNGLLEVSTIDRSITTIDVTGLAPGYEEHRISALTAASETTLYAVVEHPSQSDHLYEIDTTTWDAAWLTEIDLSFPSDLELDDNGVLWASTGGNLYRVDLISGGLTELSTTTGDLAGIAYRNGLLFSVLPNDDGSPGTLVAVDPTTGAATPVSVLSGLRGYTYRIVALDFDEMGNLWILSHLIASVITIPDIESDLSAVSDLSEGVVVHAVSVPDETRAFTLARGFLPAPIPTLDTVAMIVLAMALLVMALLVMGLMPPIGRSRSA